MSISEEIINIFETIKRLSTGFKLSLGKLSRELNAIAVVIMPSGNNNFYEGKRDIDLKFQILVKSVDDRRALRVSEQIADELLKGGHEIYSEPSFLSSDEQGCIYTAAYIKTI